MPPAARKRAARKPQDRKPKSALFSFTGHDGKTHTLPLASEGAEKLSGRVTRDAVMSNDGTGELRLGFALLEACGVSQNVVDALYDLPGPRCMTLLAEWMTHGDGKGTSLPKSLGSST